VRPLVPDVQDDSGAGFRCVLEKSAWSRLREWLKTFDGVEKGGVGIGLRSSTDLQILAYLWPRQMHQSPVFCEFDPADLVPLIVMLDDLIDEHCPGSSLAICSWVHTHPRLGIFLSGTDKNTVSQLATFDPDILAVVFDVFAHDRVEFKAFDVGFVEVPSKADDLRLDPPVWELFNQLAAKLPARMEKLGRPIEALFTPVSSHIRPEPVVPYSSDDMDSTEKELPVVTTQCWWNLVSHLKQNPGRKFVIYPVAWHLTGHVDNVLLVEVEPDEECDPIELSRLIRRLLVKNRPEKRLRIAGSKYLELRVHFDCHDKDGESYESFLDANKPLLGLKPVDPDLGSTGKEKKNEVGALDWLVTRLDKDHGINCGYV